MQITITLSDFEVKALSFCMLDPHQWVENAIKERARISAEELCSAYVSYALQNSLEVPQTKEAIIDKIIETGFRETAEQVNARNQAEIEAKLAAMVSAQEAKLNPNLEKIDPSVVSPTVSPH